MAEDDMTGAEISSNHIKLATELTIAWLSNPNNRVIAEEVLAFIQKMHATLNDLSRNESSEGSGEATGEGEAQYTPAVSVRKSLASKDHIISLIDGKPYKTLRRHLSRHGLTPEQYRERYNLKSDYPMTAPAYSNARREMAKKIGLGQKGRAAKSANTSAPAAEAPKPARGRRKKSPA